MGGDNLYSSSAWSDPRRPGLIKWHFDHANDGGTTTGRDECGLQYRRHKNPKAAGTLTATVSFYVLDVQCSLFAAGGGGAFFFLRRHPHTWKG